MPEPITPAAATLAAQAVVMPVLTAFGVQLGLRADVLLAGFCGSIAAMALLNTVPSTGDTVMELLRTSLRRVGVAVGSAMFAGYAAPLTLLLVNVPDKLILSLAFLLGAGAQQLLPKALARLPVGAPPAPTVPPVDQEGAPHE